MTEQEFCDKYKDRMRAMTMEDLPQFLTDLQSEDLDYGTVCIAIALAGTAAMWALERTPSGGITGFQASYIGWEVLHLWGAPALGNCGAKLTNYENMLYPQYEHYFNEKTLSQGVWAALQKEATKLLSAERTNTSSSVIAHWESIVDGQVPFGYTIESEQTK